jgi:S1-C subfamily serine protease
VAQVDGRSGRPASGIVWGPGLVLTADHVLADEDNIVVTAPPGPFKATIVGRDAGTDLALLRAEGIRAAAAPRGKSADLRPGHLVLALGNPGQHQVTIGVVSGSSGGWRSWRGGERRQLIQTTAQLLPGFSGGPLVSADGLVVGINSWTFGRGIPMAIGVDTAEKVAASLRDHGRIRRPYLGLGTQRVKLTAEFQNLGQETGLLVVTIEPGGAAAQAGIMQGDIIVTIKGDKVWELEGLFGAIQTLEVGSPYPFGVIRAGELKEIMVAPGERPK